MKVLIVRQALKIGWRVLRPVFWEYYERERDDGDANDGDTIRLLIHIGDAIAGRSNYDPLRWTYERNKR